MIEDQLEKLKSEYPDVTHWVRGNSCSTPDQWMPRKIDVSSKIAQLQPPASDPPIWRGLGGAGPRLRHLSVLCSGRSSHRQRAGWRAYCLQIQRAMRARSAATRQAGHWAAQCGHNSQTVIIIISVITIIIISDFCWSEQNSGFHGRRFILDIFFVIDCLPSLLFMPEMTNPHFKTSISSWDVLCFQQKRKFPETWNSKCSI